PSSPRRFPQLPSHSRRMTPIARIGSPKLAAIPGMIAHPPNMADPPFSRRVNRSATPRTTATPLLHHSENRFERPAEGAGELRDEDAERRHDVREERADEAAIE